MANTRLVRGDAVEAVRAMKEEGPRRCARWAASPCAARCCAGLVDRFRVVMFPVITGGTGAERIYDGYPDVALDMIDSRTFDGRIQLVEYARGCSPSRQAPPRLMHPPASGTCRAARDFHA